MEAIIAMMLLGWAAGWVGDFMGANSEFNETQRQNQQDITETQINKSLDQQRDTAKMQEMGMQNAYQAEMAQAKGVQSIGTAKSAIGYSGLRGATPQIGVQQQESMVQRMIQEQIRQGNESARMAGMESSLLSQKYNQKISRLQDDFKYNNAQYDNIVIAQFLKGISGLTRISTSFGGGKGGS